MMTWEQGRNRLLQYCHGTIDAKRWIELKAPNQRFKSTRLLEDYEKTINLPLPEKLIMASVTIDKTGVSVGNFFYGWKDICASAIKIQIIPNDSEHAPPEQDHYLLLCLADGQVKEFFLTDAKRLHGLTGHFIEQYKLQCWS